MSNFAVSKRVVAILGVAAAGWLFAAPNAARACTSSLEIIDDPRVTQGDQDCLSIEKAGDPGDSANPTLHIQNDCADPIQVRIPDCEPCYERAIAACFQCGSEWVLLGGDDDEGVPELVFQLDFPIDDHLGETVESSIDWIQGEESGELIIEFDMADKHPNEQATEACPGLCSVSANASPPALGALLMLVGLWRRRRRFRRYGRGRQHGTGRS